MTPRFLLLAAVLTAFPSPGFALESVGVAVQVRTDGAASGGKGAADTQKRSLAITLTNRTREDLSGLTVKWAIFASDLKSGDVGKAGSGEIKSTLPAAGSETLQSQTTTMKYTPRHAETVTHKNPNNYGNNRDKNRQRSVKIVEAKGDRYRGWGVQVLRGGTVVGEAYSTPELKAQM